MTNTTYLSIKEAADLSGKSIQTIRRLIKAKKVKFKKDRTPQGFNYLIDEQSFCDLYNLNRAQTARPIEESSHIAEEEITTAEVATVENTPQAVQQNQIAMVEYDTVNEFNCTIQKIVDQHGKEKENLFKLIETFQNKVISLENKLKVETLSQKKWYKFW